METSKDRMTEEEASQQLGLGRITLWKLRKAGKIGYLKIGNRTFYRQKHLDDYIDQCERPARVGRNANRKAVSQRKK